jgi:hypothetical protein
MLNTNINDISKEINITLKSILKNLESACEEAKEKSNKTMSEIAANHKSGMEVIRDVNQFKTLIDNIGKVAEGWKGATTALANHADTSSTANDGLSATAMLVGVLTGKINLATAAQAAWSAACAAWSTIMSVMTNPIVLVTMALAALTVGLIAYNHAQDTVRQSEERLNNANEALGNSYEKIATGISSFQDGIKSAGSILDGFNDSIIMSNEAQQNLATRMDEVQSEITEIARTAKDERGSFTESEIQRLDELFTEMQKLTEKELEIQSAYQKVVEDRAKALANTHTGTLEEYQTYSQKLINSADETREAVIQKADEQCVEEIALISAKYEAIGQRDSEACEEDINKANEKYMNAVEAANKECGDTLSIIQQGYENRAEAFKAYTESHDVLQQEEIDSNKKYNTDLEEEEARHNEADTTGIWNYFSEKNRHKEAVKEIETNHNNELAEIREKDAANLNDNVIEQASSLLAMVENTESYGGQVSEKTKTMADGVASGLFAMVANTELQGGQVSEKTKAMANDMASGLLEMVANTELQGGEVSEKTKALANSIIDNFDKLPPEAQKSMKNVMSPMLEEMKKAEPDLYSKASGIAGGILSRLNKSFDINSPSRKTRKIFQYVMEGAELGMDDETSNLYDQTDDISKSVLERFSATKFDISSLANRMKATVDYNMSSTTVGIVARNNQDASTISSNLNSDDTQEDSTFIVPVYMDSEKISEYTYKKVDGKFALAGKRVR